jgi:protein phosphatase
MNLGGALEIVGRTDTGRVRSHNEDAIHCDGARGLVILADGMGGHNAGEVASGMLTTLLASELGNRLDAARGAWRSQWFTRAGEDETRQMLAHEIIRANTAIYQAAQRQPQYAGMGTTLVMAVFFDNLMLAAHAGDSRLYRLRAGNFEQITRDHSLLQEQIDSGLLSVAEARLSQNRNLVTRAVGVEPSVEAEVHGYAVLPGDVYLLCSDGLNDMIEDGEVATLLRSSGGALDLEAAATQLVNQANDHGGRDNVSVILVRINNEFPATGRDAGWLQRFMAWLK